MPSSLYLCVHVRDLAAQALTRAHSASPIASHIEQRPAVAVLSGDPPQECVFAMNQRARLLGLELGMSRVQAESFPVVVLRRDRKREDISFAELTSCAQQFSPRIETIASPQEETCGATLVLDVSGSERLLGSACQIATTLQQSVHALGYESSVAASHNAHAAILAARGLLGTTTLALGAEAETLAALPLNVLELDAAQAQTFATWGIHTLGQMAALPTKSLVARVGQSGLRMQAQARGEYNHLLVPTPEAADAMLCEGMELEHPVELLEPLLFLLSHMLEQVMQRAAQRSLAIASVETCLVLKENALNRATENGPRLELHRTVRPALPERNRNTLLKLIQLDLELHPPEAAVIALRIEAHPARPQTMQPGLFAAQAPEAGRMEILLARLRKLVGEGRVGSPELLDNQEPEAFRVANFELPQATSQPRSQPRVNCRMQSTVQLASALRMMRPPRAVRVELRNDAPSAMHYEGQRLMLQAGSGPWRTSGAWWTHSAWCREEWDVVLQEQAPRCLRLAHDPGAGCWYVIGIYD
jgi:protein ImuB